MPRNDEGTITRSDLVKAVEAGIENAGDVLSRAEKMALRTVAASADQVARGTFKLNDCGCPLTQIGLNPEGNEAAADRHLSKFFYMFDAVTHQMMPYVPVYGAPRLLKVVED